MTATRRARARAAGRRGPAPPCGSPGTEVPRRQPIRDRQGPDVAVRPVSDRRGAWLASLHHQIRSNGRTVQTCPGVAVLWGDVPGLLSSVGSWPRSWQQSAHMEVMSARTDLPIQATHPPRHCLVSRAAPAGSDCRPAPGPLCDRGGHRPHAPKTPKPTRSHRAHGAPRRADARPCRPPARPAAAPMASCPTP